MYYRVAVQVKAVPPWQWKSSVLGSLNLLLQWLRYFQVIPADRLRIFSSALADALNTQLVPVEDQTLWSTSVPASQFLRERGLICPPEVSKADASGFTAETSVG